MKNIYLDTETTGLSHKENGLTEIGYIIEINGEVMSRGFLFINPFTYSKKVSVEESALTLTGKSVEELKGYGDSQSQFRLFVSLLDKYVDKYNKRDKFNIIGYNIDFDIDFIKEWFEDNENKYYFSYFSNKEIDVYRFVTYLSFLGLINISSHKLSSLCEHFGVPLEAHNAIDDISATRVLNNTLIQKFIKGK